MKYMLQIQQQVKWHLQGSYLPAVKGVSADPQVQNFWKTDLAGGMLKVGYNELSSINPRHPGALIGAYSDYETALRKMLEGIYINGQSVDSAMSTAQSTATKAIDTYNQDNAN
jgi:ABC-type glycerol-3-phosphate transport system substrate-binding protein